MAGVDLDLLPPKSFRFLHDFQRHQSRVDDQIGRARTLGYSVDLPSDHLPLLLDIYLH